MSRGPLERQFSLSALQSRARKKHHRQASLPGISTTPHQGSHIPGQNDLKASTLSENPAIHEAANPSEYALHILFASFVKVSEKKLNAVINSNVTPNEPNINLSCGPSVDPAFDKILDSLGHVARSQPKPVIDCLMYWRRMKSEAVVANLPHTALDGTTVPGNVPANSDAPVVAEQKSLVSIYILCRALISIVVQVIPEALADDLAEKLEDIIYEQLKTADWETIAASPLRLSNWNLFAELLGHLSGIRFSSVSDKFIEDLEKGIGQTPSKEREAQLEMIINGLRYLKIKLYPVDALEESAEFIHSLARFFSDSHGARLKHAYAYVVNRLLLSVAGNATAEVNFPSWQRAMETLYPKSSKMSSKTRHFAVAFPLACTILCVSPKELFSANWLSLIESNISRFKGSPAIALNGVLRLVWVYIYRYPESMSTTTRKLDSIVRLFFPTLKQSTNWALGCSDQLIELISVIGYKYPDYCFRTLVLPLLGADHLAANQIAHLPVSVENLASDRVRVALRGFFNVLSDLHSIEGQPMFPESPNPSKSARAWSKPDATVLNKPLVSDTFDIVAEVVVKLLLFCDSHFGGEAALEERFRTATPKAGSENTSMLNTVSPGQRTAILELFATLLEACPHCIPPRIPMTRIIDVVCKSIAHTDEPVSHEAKKAIKIFAEQQKPELVVTVYSKLIAKYDGWFAFSGDSVLTALNTDAVLDLYLNLLQIWIDQIKKKTREINENLSLSARSQGEDLSANRSEELGLTSIWTIIEETEANGLFFLCNQNRNVRKRSIAMLRMVTRLDTALDEQLGAGKSQTHGRKGSKSSSSDDEYNRVIDVLQNDSISLLQLDPGTFSTVEQSRLSRLINDHPREALVTLAESESGVDAAIWFRAFPRFIKTAFQKLPVCVVLCRNLICSRLVKSQPLILTAIENVKATSPFDILPRVSKSYSSPESLIEQWKLDLIVACSTLTLTDEQIPRAVQRHGRKRSVNVPSIDRITSARAVFQMVLPLLVVEHSPIRESMVLALGSININLFKTLLTDLHPMIAMIQEDTSIRLSSRGYSALRKNRRIDLLRTSITHVMALTCHFIQDPRFHNEQWVYDEIFTLVKDLKTFLSEPEIQNDWEYQKLRKYFCNFLEQTIESVNSTPDPQRFIPFEGRVSSFRLLEEWCGHGVSEHLIRARDQKMRQAIIEQSKDVRDRGALIAQVEIEKRNVEQAAASAMAAICAGPMKKNIVSENGEEKGVMSFNISAITGWVAALIGSSSSRIVTIGTKALTNLLQHNKQDPQLYHEVLYYCYTREVPANVNKAFFLALTETMLNNDPVPLESSHLISLSLLMLGNLDRDVRLEAGKLLQKYEQTLLGTSQSAEHLSALRSSTTAIFKQPQYLLSAMWSAKYPEINYTVFSQCCLFFNNVGELLQRDLISVMLPWLQKIELQVEVGSEDLTTASFMTLINLFEITVRCCDRLQNEIEALWTALGSGPFPGNVKAILDFLIKQSLSRRSPDFTAYCKQIVVYLGRTVAGSKILDALLIFLQPKFMVPFVKESLQVQPSEVEFPYVAQLELTINSSSKPVIFSTAHISLIFIIELIIAKPESILGSHISTILHVTCVLLDHYSVWVRTQMEDLLKLIVANLIRPKENDDQNQDALSQLANSDLQNKLWSYEDLNSVKPCGSPNPMQELVTALVSGSATSLPDLRSSWARIALSWATTCPVRHTACRSFQIFRCLHADIDQNMLSDMLARLSNTISDSSVDIRGFSMEILSTIEKTLEVITPERFMDFPQLFWAVVACLNSTNEQEFVRTTKSVHLIMDKVDLSSAANITFLISTFPPKWGGNFEGLQDLLLKGIRSSTSLGPTLELIDRLLLCPDNEIIGGNTRLMYAVLCNLPRFLQSFSDESMRPECTQTANRLESLATTRQQTNLTRVLSSFSHNRFRNMTDFMKQVLGSLQNSEFRQNQQQAIVFLMGNLSNRESWMRRRTLEILKAMMPYVTNTKNAFEGMGPDLISPLLRLLQTEFAHQALEILDQAGNVSSGPINKHILRMSLGNRSIRKEYERTVTLFGIPESSGWSIPSPALATAATRNNVHAVFYTCAVSSENEEFSGAPEVQFHIDDYGYHNERAETLASEEPNEGGSLGDMVSTLHNLDVFFTEDTTSSPSTTPTTDQNENQEAVDNIPEFYPRVAAILSRSVIKSPSTGGQPSTTANDDLVSAALFKHLH